MDSILISIKKMLGLEEDYSPFDQEIIMNINSAISILSTKGIGNPGFIITDESQLWHEYIPDIENYEMVKTCIYLRVKSTFDPPSNSFVMDAMTKQIEEQEFYLRALLDNT